MCKRCNAILNDFTVQKLDGKFEEFKRYDFTELGNEYKSDCDRLRVVTAVYCILYSEYFNLNTCLLKSDSFSRNSGDTLNTYNSSFGKGAAGIRAREMIEGATDPEIYQMLSTFKSRYHSIGNFMPLPTKTINRVSINTARNSAANDYFDLFLIMVEDFYKLHKNEFIHKYVPVNQRKGIKNLVNVMLHNAAYFELFPDFNSYISWNHFEAFYKPGRFPMFNHCLERVHFNNIEDIKSYLTNAIDIIEERSDSLIEALKRLLK